MVPDLPVRFDDAAFMERLLRAMAEDGFNIDGIETSLSLIAPVDMDVLQACRSRVRGRTGNSWRNALFRR